MTLDNGQAESEGTSSAAVYRSVVKGGTYEALQNVNHVTAWHGSVGLGSTESQAEFS